MKITMPSVAAVVGVLVLHGGFLVAQPAGVDHAAHAIPEAASVSTLDFTVNVAVSDAEIRPAAVFVPAGRSVQLLLRNRGSSEHHYRVVGLVPDELSWLADGADTADARVPDGEHNHHGRRFVSWRPTSAAEIRPNRNEVHAYVTAERRVDAVLFTATKTGTYVVQCDLHPEKVARLTVFDAAPPSIALAPPGGRHALTLALSKHLGSVDNPGAPGVQVEATYAPAEYVGQVFGGDHRARSRPLHRDSADGAHPYSKSARNRSSA
jgi:hypothetical protein